MSVLECVKNVLRVECSGKVGTAFHYGAGWVVINAHVVSPDPVSTAFLTCDPFKVEWLSLAGRNAFIFLIADASQSPTPDLAIVFVEELRNRPPLSSLPTF